MPAEPLPNKHVDEVKAKWEEAQTHHQQFVREYEKRERSYRGTLHVASEAAKWKHKLHPPYAFNLVETIVSNTVEMGLRFDVRPSPHSLSTPEEAMEMLRNAEVVGDLLRHEHRIDEMDYKQRPLYLSASICGMGVGKSYWNYSEGAVRRQGVKMVDAVDPDTGFSLKVPTITEIEEYGILRDHSTFEVVDPRDFIMHQSAKALQPFEPGGAQYLFHRCWYSFEQLKMMEGAGYVKGVDMLKESHDFSGEYSDRETELWQVERQKDLIEVLEYWCFKDGQVFRSLVGNRKVLLRDQESSPFWHGEYPFVICSTMPQLFSPRGMSDIELIEQLQEMLWEIMNQRMDNVELINNAIMLIRSDVDDPDAFEHFPGARWPVDSTDQVEALMPPFQLLEATHSTEALIKGDLQNVTAAAPFASGTETATVDQKTATGASLVMSAAQQRLLAKKYQAQQALRQEANMRIKNCQQFISDVRLAHIVGEDGAMAFRQIDPLQIQGDYIAELEPMGESAMREQRRAEAVQLSQVLIQAAPMAAAAGAPLNIREVITWMLKKWGIEDNARFFSVQPSSMGAQAAGQGGASTGGAEAATEPNMGITAGTAVDAASPSTTGGNSMSPEMAMARALSMSGGPANA